MCVRRGGSTRESVQVGIWPCGVRTVYIVRVLRVRVVFYHFAKYVDRFAYDTHT